MTFIWACRNVKIACSRAPVGSSLHFKSRDLHILQECINTACTFNNVYDSLDERAFSLMLVNGRSRQLTRAATHSAFARNCTWARCYIFKCVEQPKRRSARERILQVCSVSIRRREFYKRIIKCASQRVENLCQRAYVHRDIVCVESLYCHVNELKISSRAIKNYSQVVNWVKTNFLLLSRFSIIVRVGFSFSWDGSAQLCTTAINHGGRNKMLARWN